MPFSFNKQIDELPLIHYEQVPADHDNIFVPSSRGSWPSQLYQTTNSAEYFCAKLKKVQTILMHTNITKCYFAKDTEQQNTIEWMAILVWYNCAKFKAMLIFCQILSSQLSPSLQCQICSGIARNNT